MMTEESPQEKYNKKRVRLAEYSLPQDQAKQVEPALKRLTKLYGSKVSAITQAILSLDKKTRNRKKD